MKTFNEKMVSKKISDQDIPSSMKLRIRHDNDNVCIITSLLTGMTMFMNGTAGRILELSNGENTILKISEIIASEYQDVTVAMIIEDVKLTLLKCQSIGFVKVT